MKNNTLINARKFTSFIEAQEFCLEFYFEHVKTLNEAIINKIMSIESHGLSAKRDEEIIETIKICIHEFPEVPYDIIIYRGGNMKEKDRPYLSGTFIESIGQQFADGNPKKLHKIVVKKGAKIIPLFPINQLFNIGDPEMEIILETTKLKKHLNYYCYQ